MTAIEVKAYTPDGIHVFYGGPFDGQRIDKLPNDCADYIGCVYAWHILSRDGRLSERQHVYIREVRGKLDGWHFVRTEASPLTPTQRGEGDDGGCH